MPHFETPQADTRLICVAGSFAELFLGRYQPRHFIHEFWRSTVLEVDLRNEAANVEIFSAIFRDGFVHADLHPGNVIVFDAASVGFIGLGLVGRLDKDLRKRLLYYLYALAQVMQGPQPQTHSIPT